ncbi:MAG: SOS response-associated peptidase [Myxococcota bacterium]
MAKPEEGKMCGRMTLTRSGNEIAEYFALAAETGAKVVEEGLQQQARHNIAPSQPVATVTGATPGKRVLHWRHWGLVPAWSSPNKTSGRLFNARSETTKQKPSFREAWKRRRCLVVADGFYEWTPRNRGHQPFHFHRPDFSILAFAGLFEEWKGDEGETFESCTVLTTAANRDLEGIHHRMPVILAPEKFSDWLNTEHADFGLKAMMQPAPTGTLLRQAVGRAVNDPRFDEPSCLEPAVIEDSLQGDLFGSATRGLEGTE